MKVLLVALNAKFIHSSLALLYLKNYCRKDFPDIQTKEFTINEPIDYITKEIYKTQADLVGFSCYIWNLKENLAVARILKKVSPKTMIVFGGPEVSFEPEKFMKNHPYVDVTVFGEGEETFRELLEKAAKAFQESASVSECLIGIKGLAYWQGEKIEVQEPRPLIENLDLVPSPYEGTLSLDRNRIVYIESSRGCPFQCQYCLSSTIKGVRYFSLDRIKQDLRKFIQAGVKQVKFVDRTFNCDPQRALQIFKFLKDEAVGEINFHFEIAADLLTEEQLEFLQEVPRGLFQFEIGVQSTNEEVLEIIQRKMDFAKVKKVVQTLREPNNIHLHLDLIAGLPQEDWDSFRKSFNDVHALRPHKLQLGFLKLLKGSGVRQRAEAYNYLFIDKPPYEVLASRDLSYDKMLKLKAIEELVDKYLNSYRFGYSLPFAIDNYLPTPFDFYEQFAQVWEEKRYFGVSYSQVTMYEFFGEFFKEIAPKDYPLFKELLKLDYLLQGGIRSLPEFFLEEDLDLKVFEKEAKGRMLECLRDTSFIDRFLPELKNIPPKQRGKSLKLEVFLYDVTKVMEDNRLTNLTKEFTPIVFNYHQRDKIFQRAELFKL